MAKVFPEVHVTSPARERELFEKQEIVIQEEESEDWEAGETEELENQEASGEKEGTENREQSGGEA